MNITQVTKRMTIILGFSAKIPQRRCCFCLVFVQSLQADDDEKRIKRINPRMTWAGNRRRSTGASNSSKLENMARSGWEGGKLLYHVKASS